MPRAYYSESIGNFIDQNPEQILGVLTEHAQFALEELQRNSWMEQIEFLKHNLTDFRDGFILFEYSIPRMGKRVDIVLLIRGIVFVIEFKVGDTTHSSYALDQVLDYALDLKNFHERSHDRKIVPVLVATEAVETQNTYYCFEDNVYFPLKANRHNFVGIISDILTTINVSEMAPRDWQESVYKPTPTIIEAAQALYRGHTVAEITRNDAGAINLSLTAKAITEIIEEAKAKHEKIICFVTGVPGAGKTLAGLNIANERQNSPEEEHAVFLSGNGPLVKVLREALVRNAKDNAPMELRDTTTRNSVFQKVKTFIQNIYHFRDDALNQQQPPHEKVVIFDEAQRAWTLEQLASFMKRKRNISNFGMSEPHFLISVMDRHTDWAVIICLVGGGQEINTGEAGLLEWFNALKIHYPHWLVHFAPNLTDHEYTNGENIYNYFEQARVNTDSRFHLAVSVRSFRAESVSKLVKAILDNDLEIAAGLREVVDQSYPIVITRDINLAKKWLKEKARGTERYGLLASSGAIRLRPIGIYVQSEVDVIHWFLDDKYDIRSSYYLEEVATEFDIQGLEVDWACVIWDADLRYDGNQWEYKSFRGTVWQNIKDPTRAQYLKNAYRVLLTRARQGLVIVVPLGNDEDETRKPSYYDGTYNFLKSIGFDIL